MVLSAVDVDRYEILAAYFLIDEIYFSYTKGIKCSKDKNILPKYYRILERVTEVEP